MKPKTYLSEIHRLRRMAQRLERKIETLRHRAEGLKSITYDKDRVQTSPANTIEAAVVELVDLETRLAEVSHRYAETARIRTKQILDMDNAQYAELLYLRYVDDGRNGKGNTLDDVAEEMNYSAQHIRRLHGQALQAFGNLYLKDATRCDKRK